MPTLILYRHAKSSWDDPDLDDHERPLSKRGAKDAPTMARWMAGRKLAPDLALCSTAVRTRATLALTLPGLAAPPRAILYEDALYLATPEALIARVRDIGGDVACAMIVGHNPGLHAAALTLAGRGRQKLLAQLATKVPTAAVAVLQLPAWADVGTGSAELVAYASPKLVA
jgi:phosphohistidine phosphatase